MTSKLAGLGMAFQEPPYELYTPEDNEDSSAFTITTISKSDHVYKEVCIDFDNADLSVVKIEQLTNNHLLKRYVTERDLMIEQRQHFDPDFKVNEKYLYHGTSAEKSYICEEGLDSRMSKEGCFGKGIYFSDYPKKCVKYALKGGSGESFVLLARVICGVPKVYPKGEKDRMLVREPEKTPPYKGYRFYDSVEGCPVNHKEFVVYESRRALVEYIITFTKKDTSLRALPTALQASSVDSKQDLTDLDSDFSDSDSNVQTKSKRIIDLKDDNSETSDESDADYYEADNTGANGESAEALLKRKKEEFRQKTGVRDDYVVDHYLLRGNLNVSEAVRLYKEKPEDDELGYEEAPEYSDFELDTKEATKKTEHPDPGSEGWRRLSENDKEIVIKSLVDDFLSVTGLTEDNDYVRARLASVNYSLDLAVLAHYEEISSESGYL